MLKGFVAMLYPSRVTNAQNLEIATGSPRAVVADVAGAPSWVLTRIPDVTAGMRKLVSRQRAGLESGLRSISWFDGRVQAGLWKGSKLGPAPGGGQD
jgi:hypothetical protein